MGRRFLLLASNRLFWEPGDSYAYPWSVDLSVDPVPAVVTVSEGVTFSAVAATVSPEEALSEKWSDHFDRAEATWLVPYLTRLSRGETVTEAQLISHFVRLHGREPQVVVTR